MQLSMPRPQSLEEARLFVGTELERRFSTRQYQGWYKARLTEVGLDRGGARGKAFPWRAEELGGTGLGSPGAPRLHMPQQQRHARPPRPPPPGVHCLACTPSVHRVPPAM